MQSAIKFLGVGGAFNPEWGNSSLIINTQDINVLLDCGYAVFQNLLENKLTKKIDYVLISHLHNDHIGSLSTFVYYYNLVDKIGKLKILYQTEEFKKQLEEYLSFSIPLLEQFVEFIPLNIFTNIKAFDTYGLHVPNMQTFGFSIEKNGQRYLFSGDLADATFVQEVMKPKDNDIIFHEVDFFKDAKAHTFYKDLENELNGYQVFCYHNNPKLKPVDTKLQLVIDHPEYLYSK